MPGATHAPHHPTPEWIKKISDMHLFDDGWNKLRETIFANQKRLGIMPENAKLTPWPKGLPEWDSLSLEEKKLFIKQADVYGAYLAYADHEIGRVIQAVEDLGELDNTLIIYIGGDNGASAEGMLNGTPNEFTTFNGVAVPVKDQFLWYPFWGSERTFPHFAAGWAWAMDTPFKWVKQVASHFGGTAQGVAMSWPGHINDVGGIRRQFHHVIDIVPTILEATGIPQPDTINGIKQRPIEGVSMAYTWDKANADAPTRHTTQYFEMLGNRAIYHDGWVAATTPATLPWELSTNDAAGRDHRLQLGALQRQGGPHRVQRPGRQDAGQAQGDAGPLLLRGEEVQRAAARQLDARALEHAAPEPDGGTNGLHLFGRTDRRAGQRRAEHPEQVLHHHGRGRDPRGRRGRHDRHRRRALRRLRPVPEQRRIRRSAGARWCSSTTCSTSSARCGKDPSSEAGKHTIVFDFKSDGPGLGKGGTGVLSVDGKEVARNTMEHTTPVTFPEDETFDVGQDTRTGVALVEYRYDVPFKFTGKIDKLTFKLDPEQDTAAKPSAADRTSREREATVNRHDEKGADFRRRRRSRDRLGVADCSVARRAVVAG